MTIQTETSKVVYEADGNTNEFPVPFYFFADQIAVYRNFSETPLIKETDYVVENLQNNSGGLVKFNEIPQAGDIITITRDVELKQLITFLEGENFPAVDFEHALDKLTMGLQQLRECMARAVVVPHGTELNGADIFHCLEMLNNYWESILAMPGYVTTILNSKTDVVERDNHLMVTSAGVYDYAYDKASVDALVRKIVDTEIHITPETAVFSSDIKDYPYGYQLPLAGVTEANCPVVMFNQTDALNGNFAPFAKAYDGGIMVYVKKNDDYTTTIPLILLL